MDKKEDRRRRKLQQSLQEGHRYLFHLFLETRERREELLEGIVEKAKECRRLRRILRDQQGDFERLTELYETQMRRIGKAETYRLSTNKHHRMAQQAIDKLINKNPAQDSDEKLLQAQADADEAVARMKNLQQQKVDIERNTLSSLILTLIGRWISSATPSFIST